MNEEQVTSLLDDFCQEFCDIICDSPYLVGVIAAIIQNTIEENNDECYEAYKRDKQSELEGMIAKLEGIIADD